MTIELKAGLQPIRMATLRADRDMGQISFREHKAIDQQRMACQFWNKVDRHSSPAHTFFMQQLGYRCL